MRWPSLLKPKSGSGQGAPPTETETYNSLVFNILYHHLQGRTQSRILDLGAAFGANVQFMSQFPCTLHIEDLYETLVSFDFFDPEDGFSDEEVFSYLFPYGDTTRFDVILAWDLFNYLEEKECSHLVRHLERFCSPGTLLFSLISTLRYIPEKPTNFRILDSERLHYEYGSSVLRASPQYRQDDLNRMMPRFRVHSSFLLRNGFKEYLFAFNSQLYS